MRNKYRDALEALELMETFIYSTDITKYNAAASLCSVHSDKKLFIAEKGIESVVLIRRVR